MNPNSIKINLSAYPGRSRRNPRDFHQGHVGIEPRYLILVLLLSMTGFDLKVHAQKYDSKGKRDPFYDLELAQREFVPTKIQPLSGQRRPPGLAGWHIHELTVVGMASNHETRIVLLKGPDEFIYLAGIGSKLFDGYVANIADDEVVFTREMNDTGGNKTSIRVVKPLYTMIGRKK